MIVTLAMTFLQGLILGAIQGVTEWLPISSEGITSLVLVNIFHLPLSEAVFLALWLHLGTLLAAVYYFRPELVNLARHLPAYIRDIRRFNISPQDNLITFLIVATLASAAIGGPLLLLSLDNLEFSGALATAIIGLFLIVTGIVQKCALSKRNMEDKPVGIKDSLLVGVVQAFSILPGLSRSGLTVSALLFRQYRPKQALELSFLLSIPAVLVTQVGLGLMGEVNFSSGAIAGILSSAFLGFLTINGLMRFALRVPFWGFCIFLGLLSLMPWIFSL